MNSDDLRKLMQQKMSTSPSLRSLMKRIRSGKATFRDTAEYSRIYSDLLGKCLSDNVLSLDDREAAAADMLRESYDHTNSILSQVQTDIDKKNGINLRPRAAAFPLDRVTQFSHSLVDPTVEDSVIKRRARNGGTNISMSHHDDYMEANAEFRSNAGLKCYITRETDGKCCKWCTAIAGRYVYGEEPHDVYRRHDNCGCSVIYENGRQRQDVWSKRTWEKPKVGAGAPPPTKFSPEQARAMEQEKLRNIHGLSIDNGGRSGIIRESIKPNPITEITDKAIESVPKVNIYGYTDEQCAMIQKQHKELLEYSRKNNENKEVAFVFDSSLESRKEFMGSDDKIDFGRSLYGSDITVLHNHPRNSSYSVTDIIFFGDNSNVKTLTIVKNNGKVEYLTKSEEFDPSVFKLEYDRLYRKIVKTGTDSEKNKFVKTLLNKSKSGVIWSERI